MAIQGDSNGDKLADELLLEAKGLKEATVTSMLNEISFLKQIIKLLGVMLLILVVGVGTLCYRTFFVTGPKVDDTNQIVREVRNNSEALSNLQSVVDDMNAFVGQVKANSNPALQEELYKAVFDIRKVACARDPKICDQAGVIPRPPPTTIPVTTTTTTKAG